MQCDTRGQEAGNAKWVNTRQGKDLVRPGVVGQLDWIVVGPLALKILCSIPYSLLQSLVCSTLHHSFPLYCLGRRNFVSVPSGMKPTNTHNQRQTCRNTISSASLPYSYPKRSSSAEGIPGQTVRVCENISPSCTGPAGD